MAGQRFRASRQPSRAEMKRLPRPRQEPPSAQPLFKAPLPLQLPSKPRRRDG
jgi:hypothetical protein